MEMLALTPIQQLNFPLVGNTVFVKRDDLLPFSFGGNKARKAVLFFREIITGRYDCVVTYGTNSSNHCRIIANMATMHGLPCYVVSPETVGRMTANSRIIDVLGASVILSHLSEVGTTIRTVLQDLENQGCNPYFIPGGGHGNLGTQAYVDCYEEIRTQERILGLHFDFIFLPSGTGTTQAGLVCGKLVHGDDTEIVGISIARRNPRGGQVVLESVSDYLESRNFSFDFTRSIQFVDDYVLEGYGSYNREILDVIRSVFVSDGIPLDTTYTGKAFWGMQRYLEKQGIRGKNILFIHTGGTPLFFDVLGELAHGVGLS